MSSFLTQAQESYVLQIEVTDTTFTQKELQNLIHYKKQLPTENDRNKEIQSLLLNLYDHGYLTAHFDSLSQDSLSLIAYLTIGDTYKWGVITPGNVDEEILSSIVFRDKLYNNKFIYFNSIVKLNRGIITYCENNGYPFASVKLDSIRMEGNYISASLNLTKNIQVNIDSIVFKGDAKINPVYIHNYLGISPGDLYNESQVKKIKARLKELPFIKESKPFDIVFTESITKIIFYLENKKSSQLDGILGILPNNDISGKVLFTGDAHLKLQNSFGRGELIDVNWRKLQNQTQDFNTQFIYPFLFSTPFGIDLKLDLYKRDTTFLNVSQMAGIQYLISGGNYFKVFIKSKNSSLLSSSGLENLSRLPNYADIKTILYGIGFKTEQLDYRINPRKGYKLIFNGGVGNRKITKHPKIKESLYENLELTSTQYDLDLNIDYFIPVIKRSTLKLSSSSAYLSGKSSFENELFRIGGLKSLRGFDEESIFASTYSIMTVELRYLLEQNSYAHVFWNGAYYENTSINFTGDRYDTPYGFGAGVSFETKAGIFSISYALGKQFNNPILLRAGKVHFGIVSYF